MLTPRQAAQLAEDLLSPHPSHTQSEGDESKSVENAIPEQIAGCRIIRVIGTGGMGTVYEARQDHPRRTVAIKVLNRGLTSQSALRRFEFEADLLARLSHPGIAQVHDAGTFEDQGQQIPYFVMEYIPGAKTITEYADAHQLKLNQRLELFIRICDAVHHGHQKGIIHRDLKPANILIADPDEDRVHPSSTGGEDIHADTSPKIIDFGVACSTDSDIAVTTMHTAVGQLIGTLQYMSPEQCEGDPRKLDIRSDVYSLGVVLFELVTSRLPYDVSNMSLPSATRMIQEADPAPPQSFVRKLHRDIVTIILKALQKDVTQRYQSAAELSSDLRRHLNGEPIDASQPTLWQRSTRWMGRHPIVTTSTAWLTIVPLIIVGTWGALSYLNTRPDHFLLRDEGREACLVSVGGRIMHSWGTIVEEGIRATELVKFPTLGSGHGALIGYSSDQHNPRSGALCMFPCEGNLDIPIWCKTITQEYIPPSDPSNRNIEAHEFGVQHVSTTDIFKEYDGPEVIGIYYHHPYSRCCVRIYTLNGELLWQFWHDGHLDPPYWMPDVQQLVFKGFNSYKNWEHRDAENIRIKGSHPRILFSVKPQLGMINNTYLETPDLSGIPQPEWYQCILPMDKLHLFGRTVLSAPAQGADAGRAVRIRSLCDGILGAEVCWTIDEHGIEIPGTRVANDIYKSNMDALGIDEDTFHYGELPPIVNKTEIQPTNVESSDD